MPPSVILSISAICVVSSEPGSARTVIVGAPARASARQHHVRTPRAIGACPSRAPLLSLPCGGHCLGDAVIRRECDPAVTAMTWTGRTKLDTPGRSPFRYSAVKETIEHYSSSSAGCSCMALPQVTALGSGWDSGRIGETGPIDRLDCTGEPQVDTLQIEHVVAHRVDPELINVLKDSEANNSRKDLLLPCQRERERENRERRYFFSFSFFQVDHTCKESS